LYSNGWAFDICDREECNKQSGCHCPLDVPNFVKVEENPMAVLITGSGVINRTFIDNLEKSMDGIRSPYHCHPRVNLFLEVELMSEEELDDIASATSRGHLQYEFGIYGKPSVNAVDQWIEIIRHGKERLEAALSKHKRRKVEMFRAKDYEWTDNMYYALHKLGIQRDGSYVSHQPLWPFTLPCHSALCQRRIDNVPLSDLGYTYICPGRFPTLWIIPNNVLFAEPGSKMSNCTWLGDCFSLAMAANYSPRQLIVDNFNYRSEATAKFNGYWQRKEPFSLNLEADFFSRIIPGRTETMTELLGDALQYISLEAKNRKDDVYFGSIPQLTKWMSKSQPTKSQLQNQLHHLEDFYCVTGYTNCENGFAFLSLVPMGLNLVWYVLVIISAIIQYFVGKVRNSGTNNNTPKPSLRASLLLTKWITLFGSFAAFTVIEERWPKLIENRVQRESATFEVRRKCSGCRKITKYLVIFALKLVSASPTAVGPLLLLIEIGKDAFKITESKYGFGFLVVLLLLTIVVFVYFIVFEFASHGHASKQNELRMTFENAKLEEEYKNIPALSGSFCIFLLVAISNITLFISMFLLVFKMTSRPERRITGWYTTSDCKTILMYFAISTLSFRMGHMSLIHTFSLNKWVQGHLKLKEKTGKLQKNEKKNFVNKSIFYIIPIFHLAAASFLHASVSHYILSIAKQENAYELAQRCCLFISLLIIFVVPFLANWLVIINYQEQVDENRTATTGREETADGNQEKKIDQGKGEATALLEHANEKTEGNEVKTHVTLTKDELQKMGISDVKMGLTQILLVTINAIVMFVILLIVEQKQYS
jgi:hypothetical protein